MTKRVEEIRTKRKDLYLGAGHRFVGQPKGLKSPNLTEIELVRVQAEAFLKKFVRK